MNTPAVTVSDIPQPTTSMPADGVMLAAGGDADDEIEAGNVAEVASTTPVQEDAGKEEIAVDYSVGAVVRVEARFWAGINESGGVARITKIHPSDDGNKYNVRYVLGGQEKDVDAIYIKPHEDGQDEFKSPAKKSAPDSYGIDQSATAAAAMGVGGASNLDNLPRTAIGVMDDDAMDQSATASAAMGVAGASKLDNLTQMVAGVMDDDAAVQTEYTTQLRMLLSVDTNAPIQQVIDSGVVPRFVEFLQRDDRPTLQFEAAWVIIEIAAGTSDHIKTVIEVGAVPIFVHLLTSPNDNVREQAVFALGLIAGDSPPCRDIVLQAGAMQPLLQQLHQNSKLSMLRNAAWTLSNFCRGNPQPNFDMVSPALPHLASLLSNPSTPVDAMVDAAEALSYLSDGGDQRIKAFQDVNITNRLVELLSSDQPNLVAPCVRTLGNFVSDSDGQTQVVVDANVLGMMKPLLSHRHKDIRKESFWLLSNIAAGTHIQISSVIHQAGLITAVVDAINNDQWEAVRKEATWVIFNICTSGTTQHIESLVEAGAIEALCGILGSADAQMIAIALEALQTILKTGEVLDKVAGYVSLVGESGGIDHILGLQEHENNVICENAIAIIGRYFRDDARDGGSPAADPLPQAEKSSIVTDLVPVCLLFGLAGVTSYLIGCLRNIWATILFVRNSKSRSRRLRSVTPILITAIVTAVIIVVALVDSSGYAVSMLLLVAFFAAAVAYTNYVPMTAQEAAAAMTWGRFIDCTSILDAQYYKRQWNALPRRR